jgi:AraC-like DNA-binding protein
VRVVVRIVDRAPAASSGLVGCRCTLRHQVSRSLDVRAWQNDSPEPFDSTAAHASIEVSWAESGFSEYKVGRQRVRLPPREVTIVPAGVEHFTRLDAGGRSRVLGFDAAVLDEIADAMHLRGSLQTSLSGAHPRIHTLGQLIFDEVADGLAGVDLVVDALTEALAVALLRTCPEDALARGGAPRDLRIRRAMAFIDASYAEPLSIDCIAKVAGMSRYHFSRLFRAQVGMSPHRYLTDVRMARASALLRSGRMSVTEAALTVGCNDLGRFGRTFRARYGVAPSEARASDRRRIGG